MDPEDAGALSPLPPLAVDAAGGPVTVDAPDLLPAPDYPPAQLFLGRPPDPPAGSACIGVANRSAHPLRGTGPPGSPLPHQHPARPRRQRRRNARHHWPRRSTAAQRRRRRPPPARRVRRRRLVGCQPETDEGAGPFASPFDSTDEADPPTAAVPADDEPHGIVSLPTEPAPDLRLADGDVDIVTVQRADNCPPVRVGNVVDIEAVVVNASPTDRDEVHLCATLPTTLDPRDHRWTEHRDGRLRLTQRGLPAGPQVTVPLRVRIDEAHTLTGRFYVDQTG